MKRARVTASISEVGGGTRPVTRRGEAPLPNFPPPLEKCVGHSLKNLDPSQKTLCSSWRPKLVTGLGGTNIKSKQAHALQYAINRNRRLGLSQSAGVAISESNISDNITLMKFLYTKKCLKQHFAISSRRTN